MAKIFNRAIQVMGEKQKVGTPVVRVIERDVDNLVVRASGATVPTDTDAGYAKGCIFIQTDGGIATTFYVNEGSSSSADFNQTGGGSGATGYTGYSGYSGYTGYTGADSTVTGPTGYTGYTGYTGSQGAAGIQGYTGYSGYSGYTGYTGAASTVTGPTGYTGYSGYTGYTGADSAVTGYTGYTGGVGSTEVVTLVFTGTGTSQTGSCTNGSTFLGYYVSDVTGTPSPSHCKLSVVTTTVTGVLTVAPGTGDTVEIKAVMLKA